MAWLGDVTSFSRIVLGALLALATLASGCSCGRGQRIGITDPVFSPDAAMGLDSGPQQFSESSIANATLALVRAEPARGPFTGGNSIVLRGTGFVDGAEVSIGGLPALSVELLDSRRLRVVVPAGEPGPVDIRVVQGDDETLVNDAYTYDRIGVEPARGAISGGTQIRVVGNGTRFEPGDAVFLGTRACESVVVDSETSIQCMTPASSAGFVDVSVRRNGNVEQDAAGAFEYYDPSDPRDGGLSGGPIDGSLTVTVLDDSTRLPLPMVFVAVGENPVGEFTGFTDDLGAITFSSDTLAGPLTVHAALDCYERTSVVSFDAQNVTIFLARWTDDPRCQPPATGTPPNQPLGPGRNGAFLAGELIWRGPNEFGPNPWENIPEPREGWERVAYVFTTDPSIRGSNPSPSIGGTRSRVTDRVAMDSVLGYPYSIFVRPEGLAVYALAGLENLASGRFIPYVMGITRNILAMPDQTIEGVDIYMDIPLDQTLDVELEPFPPRVRSGPKVASVRAVVDLGGEGFVLRNLFDADYDSVNRRDTTTSYRLPGQPAFQGPLSDGRYRVLVTWSSDIPYGRTCLNFNSACTQALVVGAHPGTGPIRVPELLAIPEPVSPGWDERVPSDRILRFRVDGAEPDFFEVEVEGADGNPAWRIFLPGTAREVPLPDFSSVPGLMDLPPGALHWRVNAISVPSFDFNSFTYANLATRTWERFAFDELTAQL